MPTTYGKEYIPWLPGLRTTSARSWNTLNLLKQLAFPVNGDAFGSDHQDFRGFPDAFRRMNSPLHRVLQDSCDPAGLSVAFMVPAAPNSEWLAMRSIFKLSRINMNGPPFGIQDAFPASTGMTTDKRHFVATSS